MRVAVAKAADGQARRFQVRVTKLQVNLCCNLRPETYKSYICLIWFAFLIHPEIKIKKAGDQATSLLGIP
jgi:hypothetical protein